MGSSHEVISPEGAATILYRDAQRAEEVAERLKLTAADCLKLGVADDIIPEPAEGAHTNSSEVMQALQHHLLHAFAELDHVPLKQLLAQRYRKFRRYGQFHQEQAAIIQQSQQTIRQLTTQLHIAILSAQFPITIRRRERERGLASS